MNELLPRHGSTHFANIPYGYYALLVSFGFVLLTIAGRFVVGSRLNSNSHFGGVLGRKWYNASPALGLLVLYMALLIPFVKHYSISDHVTLYLKRLGRLSYVLATLNLFLTLRPNLLLPRFVYLDLIPLHKWISRSIFLLALLHGVGFLAWWATTPESSVIDKVFHNVWNFLGVVVLVLLTLLVLVSVRVMRKISYRTFYFTHSIASWTFIFVTGLHARPGVALPYILINSGLLALHVISKTAFARPVELLLSNHEDNEGLSRLVQITLPRKAMPESFSPGSHLRISPYGRLNPLYYLLPSHPYTVSSLPSDPNVSLIIREHPKGFRLQTGLRYTIQNHYSSLSQKCLDSAERVALVCGGSGISYGLPIFQFLASIEKKDQIKHLKLIWLVREKDDLSVLKNLKHLPGDTAEFHVFITGSTPKDDTDNYRSSSNVVQPGPVLGHEDLEFELESLGDEVEQNGALKQSSGIDLVLTGVATNVYLGKRLDWAADLAQLVEEDSLETTWLVTCGPKGLNDAGREFAYQNKINLASETYAL
ncbi:LAME_0E09384g1_1 [Lachancea meyersii CBS 8951]|uniref:Probable metalloreductase AIM14 n=1 Tax=Lachancea meyersii CBS 8951 TaxID=1266667 RepID=A0A1G4JJJ1_9SACH|nr:LAME_0E09384g1_1 [Lachancea meyersii CBS 8951]